ncbi:glycosyl transferase [Rhizobium sp. Root708]|uniref:glycosyltransferase family 2 protein n=1 Tax=Rhizobium sp. Root708 TaxID=1736592 RepID=UPI0006F9A36F|nr:glycosyltransferase family 2 protein [Rhizobium sp. Root708]KRB49291.1 glycosyl transferase [Rhizobium sp. Root708]
MYSSTPLVSIIITCFNYADYINQCIESALAQTYSAKEVIVVDDGSGDQSWDRILEYGDLVISKRTHHQGSIGCCFAGLSLARGDFVYFLDADDVLLPNALNELAPYFRPEVSKIQFMLSPIDRAGTVVGEPFPRLLASEHSLPLIQSITERGYYSTPPTSGNIYRRDVYDDLGDLSYEKGIDGVSYLLAPFLGNVVSIEKALGQYRMHNTNLSGFSALTTERMTGDAKRFTERLRHLQELIEARGVQQSIEIRSEYAYVLEMNLFGAVTSGQRPTPALVLRYLRAVWRENSDSIRRASYLALAAGLMVLPDAGRRNLVRFRVDPSRTGHVRRGLKRMLSAGRQASY